MADEFISLPGVSLRTERVEEQRVLGTRLAEAEATEELVDLDAFQAQEIIDARSLEHVFPEASISKLVALAEASSEDPLEALKNAARNGSGIAGMLRVAACEAAARVMGYEDDCFFKISERKTHIVSSAPPTALVDENENDLKVLERATRRKTASWEPLAEKKLCPLCGFEVITGNLDQHIASKECAQQRKRKRTDECTGRRSDDIDYEEDEVQEEEEKAEGRVRATESIEDDADDYAYAARIEALEENGELGESDDETGADFWQRPRLKSRLFAHQATGVDWLSHMDTRGTGGIVGDEMGLGKTATTAFFLGSLYDAPSTRGIDRRRSVLILAPTSILAHWVTELHRWAPRCRVVVLHRAARAFDQAVSAGAATLAEFLAAALTNDDSNSRRQGRRGERRQGEGQPRKGARIVLASYEAMRSLGDALTAQRWGYVVLDEGQRIRNPQAQISQLCKRVRTSRRLLLSGTPVQNNLRELWSLIDFCCPGALGALDAFENELALPIRRGGFNNATRPQVELAFRCAVALRDVIKPLLLRRTKASLCGVGGPAALPPKKEHVLLCRLTPDQIALYRQVLASEEVSDLLNKSSRNYSSSRYESSSYGRGKKYHDNAWGKCFRAITHLRQICNHPDIYAGPPTHGFAGSAARSAKLAALDCMLKQWYSGGHRCALFSQSRKLLDIVEALLKSRHYAYARIDGSTPPASRQATADCFNAKDSYIFCMICTTRTGGVGMSLIGADRVVLYDPDWNPQTDAQARERAWRLGQTRPVTVYRFVCAGTIEEKIYHRQIFKQALTNRILQDPRQRRLFSQSELTDLFSLGAAALPTSSSDDVDTAALEPSGLVVKPHQDDSDNPQISTQQEPDKQVLEALWSGSNDVNIASVFRHEALDSQLGADAEREAKRAVRALRAEFQPAASQPQASSSILATIRGRTTAARAHASTEVSAQEDDDHQQPSDGSLQLVRRLRRFFDNQRRSPDTETILSHFSDVHDAILFKSILKQLAELRNGRWIPRG